MDQASVAKTPLEKVREALCTRQPTTGSTHNFYHYPARFPPAIARAVIDAFSEPGDAVLDPFMGGGTTVIEALALGRRAIGVDLNALAHFVAGVRTTPLSSRDEEILVAWAERASSLRPYEDVASLPRSGTVNLPRAVELFVTDALKHAETLPFPRQRAFARCALLRLGQWSLDCRDFVSPRRKLLADQLPILVHEMLDGMSEFVDACGRSGRAKYEITRCRSLHHGSSANLGTLVGALNKGDRPRLVFTSPPYPGVHVLYHRWQYRGRKETSAPYWIADVPDGFGGAYYTAGSRTPTGLTKFFDTITKVFTSVRATVASDAVIVQLVGFNNVSTQLPLYLGAMRAAGFEEHNFPGADSERLGRRVPNRRWYAKLKGEVDASAEIMLVHRPTKLP
ncbi:MAG: hypothetical protein JST92_01595 [Deltaproteobacteria bacterium]|nr:hypothetical protein [Deltaproteobacteria bacterium]